MPPMDLFLGIDAGGTPTHAAVAGRRGVLVGHGLAAGGNLAPRGLAAVLRCVPSSR